MFYFILAFYTIQVKNLLYCTFILQNMENHKIYISTYIDNILITLRVARLYTNSYQIKNINVARYIHILFLELLFRH